MRNRIVTLGLMVALSIGGAAWAQQLTDERPVTGRVTSVDTTAKTFTLETANGPLVFKTDMQTMFMRGNSPVNLSAFKVGDQLEVTYAGVAANRMAGHVHAVNSPNAYAPPTSTPPAAYAPTSNPPMSMPTSNRTGGTVVTGRVTSVDVPGRMVTVETAAGLRTYTLGTDAKILTRAGSNDFNMIESGDQVRMQVSGDSRTADRIEFVSGEGDTTGNLTANRDALPRTASPLPLLALSGLAMIGAGLLLRARRLRAV